MPQAIKVGVITQAEGAHLPDYFGALAKIGEAAAAALADPSGKTADAARKALGARLTKVFQDPAAGQGSGRPGRITAPLSL